MGLSIETRHCSTGQLRDPIQGVEDTTRLVLVLCIPSTNPPALSLGKLFTSRYGSATTWPTTGMCATRSLSVLGEIPSGRGLQLCSPVN